jgi:hypothetical protein
VREAEDVREGRRTRRYGWFAQTDLLESHIRGLAACTPPWRSRTRTVPMRWRPLRFFAVRHSALGVWAAGGASSTQRCTAWPYLTNTDAQRSICTDEGASTSGSSDGVLLWSEGPWSVSVSR